MNPEAPAINDSAQSLQVYEPDRDTVYSIDAASHIAQVPRHRIAVYCRHGLVAPAEGPARGALYFNNQGIRTLRRLEAVREVCGLNIDGLRLTLDLIREIEHLRARVQNRAPAGDA